MTEIVREAAQRAFTSRRVIKFALAAAMADACVRVAHGFEDFIAIDETLGGRVFGGSSHRPERHDSPLYDAIQPCNITKVAPTMGWSKDSANRQLVLVDPPHLITAYPINGSVAQCIREHAATFIEDELAHKAAEAAAFAAAVGAVEGFLLKAVTVVGIAAGAACATALVVHCSKKAAVRDAANAAMGRASTCMQAGGRGIVACAPGWLAHRLQYGLTPWRGESPEAGTEMT